MKRGLGLALGISCAACGALLGLPDRVDDPELNADGSVVGIDAGVDGDPGAVDGSGGGDAKGDADAGEAGQPACPASKVLCGGICIDGLDCTQCASAKLFCRSMRTCITSCSSCRTLANQPLPIECTICDSNGANPLATCEGDRPATFCLSGDLSTAYDGGPGRKCDCSNTDVANCPGAMQTCLANGSEDECRTCGEIDGGTGALPCKGGGVCNEALKKCQ